LLASITPLGERGRQCRWGITVSALIVGASLGGGALGIGLGALGHALLSPIPNHGRVVDGLLAGAVIAGIALDARVMGTSVPTLKRQVAKEWLDDLRGWAYGFGFGVQLGVGFATIVTSAATYVAFAACLLSGSWLKGAIIGGVFGFVRGATNLASFRIDSPVQLVGFHRRMEHTGRQVLARTRFAEVATIMVAAIGTLPIGGLK